MKRRNQLAAGGFDHQQVAQSGPLPILHEMRANGADERLRPEGTHYDPDTFRRGVPQRFVEFPDLSRPRRSVRAPNRLQESRVESSKMNRFTDGGIARLAVVRIVIALYQIVRVPGIPISSHFFQVILDRLLDLGRNLAPPATGNKKSPGFATTPASSVRFYTESLRAVFPGLRRRKPWPASLRREAFAGSEGYRALAAPQSTCFPNYVHISIESQYGQNSRDACFRPALTCLRIANIDPQANTEKDSKNSFENSDQ